MSRLSEAWKALTGRTVTPTGTPFASYSLINGQYVGLNDNQTSYITNGYEANDIIYSIVNLITDKCKLPEWAVYKVKDEESYKRYKSIFSRKDISVLDFKKAVEYRSKALEVVNAGKLTELMKYPNEFQTMTDMVGNFIGYKLLTGNSYLWADTLDAGANMGKPQSLNVLPAQDVTIIAQSKQFPVSPIGYKILSIDQPFTKAHVLHDKFANYSFDISGSHLYGTAPLKAALKRLSRNNNALKASDSAMQNGGLPGIIYMDDPRVLNGNVNPQDTRKQAEAVKDSLKRGPDRVGELATSGYKMGFVPIGISPVDLAVIESEKWDLKRFCSVFGVPAQLAGDDNTSTYNNVKEAEKALTSRVAMPLLVSLRNHLNRKLSDDWGYNNTGYVVDFDQTVFTELQEDVVAKSTWVNQLRGLSPNEQRTLLGLEKIDNPLFNEQWIKPEDGTPLSEWQIDDSGTNDTEDVPDK